MLELTAGWVADELGTPLPMLELNTPPPNEELSVHVELEIAPPMVLDEAPPQYVPGRFTVLAWHSAVVVTVEMIFFPESVDVRVL